LIVKDRLQMKTDKLIILAGGISSRMKRPASQKDLPVELLKEADEKSKAMIGLGGGHRPFLDYLLYNAREAGLQEIVIVVGEKDSSIREYYGQKDRGNDFHGLTISYAIQKIPLNRKKPLGTADALQQALEQFPEWRKEKFVVCNSDNLYSVRALKMLEEFEGPGAWIDYDREALAFSDERISAFAVTQKDPEGNLIDSIEKPTPEQVEWTRGKNGVVGVSMNVWLLSGELIYPFLLKTPLHPIRQEKELPEAILRMSLKHPGSMKAIPLKEHVPDLTSKEDIIPVREFIQAYYRHLHW